MEHCGELPMALAGFSLQEVRTDVDLPQPSPLPLRESYPRCVHAGDLLPPLCPVPLALAVPLAILIIPGWALLLEGTSSITCGELRMLLLRGIWSCVTLAQPSFCFWGFCFLATAQPMTLLCLPWIALPQRSLSKPLQLSTPIISAIALLARTLMHKSFQID